MTVAEALVAVEGMPTYRTPHPAWRGTLRIWDLTPAPKGHPPFPPREGGTNCGTHYRGVVTPLPVGEGPGEGFRQAVPLHRSLQHGDAHKGLCYCHHAEETVFLMLSSLR